jgi:hypothetical protein
MTQEKAFLPLGSVVILKGTVKKLMIVKRATVLDNKYVDYGAVFYPEGEADDTLGYFNGEDILKVVFEGFSDDDDALLVEQLAQGKKAFLENPSPLSVESAIKPETVTTEEEDPFAVFTEDEGDE